MAINSIEQLNALTNTVTAQVTNAKSAEHSDFSSWLQNEISTANDQIQNADENLRQFAIGATDNLHEVMISLEKAKTSFELIVEVRNRLLEGYQEIMRMQV